MTPSRGHVSYTLDTRPNCYAPEVYASCHEQT
jgi:hypothetical protein